MKYCNKSLKIIKNNKEKYLKEIVESIRNTVVFSKKIKIDSKKEKTKIFFMQNSTIDAIFNIKENKKILVLNFSDYTEPGGLFLYGGNTQEESLCYSSTLYNVLSSETVVRAFYLKNRKINTKGIYSNTALYTPNILFFNEKNNYKFVDVISCAAPNKNIQLITEEENHIIFKDRIDFLFSIVNYINPDVFIIGAWGCGAFGQDAQETAIILKEIIEEKSNVSNIIFAISDNHTFNIFKNVFNSQI